MTYCKIIIFRIYISARKSCLVGRDLSAMQIVEELSQQLRQLIHCCSALELSITQVCI